MSLGDWFYNLRTERIREKKIRKGTYVKPKITKLSTRKIDKKVCNAKGCRKRLNLANRHDCPYCRGFFCDEHRLPESHDCEDPRLPSGMRKFGSKTQRHL